MLMQSTEKHLGELSEARYLQKCRQQLAGSSSSSGNDGSESTHPQCRLH